MIQTNEELYVSYRLNGFEHSLRWLWAIPAWAMLGVLFDIFTNDMLQSDEVQFLLIAFGSILLITIVGRIYLSRRINKLRIEYRLLNSKQ